MLRTLRRGLYLCAAIGMAAACQTMGVDEQPDTLFKAAIVDEALSELVTGQSVVGVSALIYSGDEELYYGDFG